jgi:PAS domain S-box-containing protein
MSLDIRTLAVILGVTHTLQVIVLSLQATISRGYRGVGWWLAWSASSAVGFVFINLRSIPAIGRVSILAQNGFIVLGTIFLYIGVIRFLGQRENRAVVLSIFPAFLASLAYFIYVDDSIAVRTVIISVTLAATSLLSAHGLAVHKTASTRAAANFCATVFVAHALVFLERAASVLAGADASDIFHASFFNGSIFLDGIIAGILWTCGLIIMVNQRSNAELKDASDRFELLFHTSPEAVLIARVDDGLCREVNEGFLALSDFERAEIVGHPCQELAEYCDPADRDRLLVDLRDKGSCDNLELGFFRKDGSPFTGITSARVFSFEGAPHVITVTRDITGRKRAEEALRRTLSDMEQSRRALLSVTEDHRRAEAEVRRLNAELEQRVHDRTTELQVSNRELEAFTYSVSHDLKAPLRAIDGYSRILLEEYAQALDAEAHRLLDIVRTQAQRMGQLIDSLLSFARVGRQDLVQCDVDMEALARSVFEEQTAGLERPVELELEPMPRVRGDRTLLRLLWTSLVANAVKFTSSTPCRKVSMGGRSETGHAVYWIQDNGVGFDMQYADKLFGVFQRLHSGREFGGTGVGLALVQRITKRHGGDVHGVGTPGGGARFVFRLPLPKEAQ